MALRSFSAGEDPAAVARVRLGPLVDLFGSNGVAEMLAVSRSQPSRWRSGQERISPQNQRRIVDLDYVVTRFGQLYSSPALLRTWLTSQNPHLGARPLDVLRLEGPRPLLLAIDALAQGAPA